MCTLPPFLVHAAVCFLAGATTMQSAPPPAPAVPHRLDGSFDDWSSLDRVATKYDREGDAAAGAADVTTVSLASDPHWLWIYITLAQPMTLQGLDQPMMLLIDVDAMESTGAQGGPMVGAEFAVIFSPSEQDRRDSGDSTVAANPRRISQGAHGEGVVVRRLQDDGTLGDRISSESVGLGMAPAFASTKFEIRLARSATHFAGFSAAARVVSLRLTPPDRVDLIEETEVSRTLLVPRSPVDVPKADASSVARPPDTMRLISWNAEFGALFKNPEPFGATLKSLDPDVVLWQELGKDATAASLTEWMNARVPSAGAPWKAIVSGGDLRTGIAAKGALTNAPFLDGLQRSTPKGNRPVRITGALLDVNGSPFLLASLHLKCCGRYQSSEDDTRTAEAAAIRDALRQAQEKLAAEGRPAAFTIVAGDFNLVGDRSVLTKIGAGADLAIVDAYQLDGTTNATWRSAGNQFVPSRLDWMLFSNHSLDVQKSFVFSTEDLATDAVTQLALPASALGEASDHQPIVVDVVLRPRTFETGR
ncbi:MAG: endonuclease/exonuclease/phosphatase family protein [Phycisphaerae bacterium]|nr:endonuclease/exonuclease/phosphatase family protein [Phycisphaerae bacterium]